MKKNTISPVRIVLVLFVSAGILGLFSHCRQNNVPPITQGYALAIGLNKVNPSHYAGWDGELMGCEPDATDMLKIAKSQGLKSEKLITSEATREKVLDKLGKLAEELKPGDLLVVSYSGHGGQIPDQNGDEEDGLDETWCLYNGELLDDELYGAWMKFQAGVRILVFSDSCHSGTVLKMIKRDMENPPSIRARELDEEWEQLRVPVKLDRAKIFSLPEMREAVRVRPYLRNRTRSLPPSIRTPSEDTTPEPEEDEADRVFVSRSMSPAASMKTYKQNQSFYDELGKAAPQEDPNQVKASVILISGCKDTQTSADIGFNGLFTWMLKRAWNNGAFTGDHHQFHEKIRDLVKGENPQQTPNFFLTGEPNDVFIGQRPYTVK